MKEFVDKLIGMLEKNAIETEVFGKLLLLSETIEIIKELAEEYNQQQLPQQWKQNISNKFSEVN